MATCCASRCASAEYFGEAIAERDLRRYRQKGPDRETRLFLDRLLACRPLGDALLDVGGGVGVVSFELLAAGVHKATVVEASTASLDAARTEADRRGLIDRMQFLAGDFVSGPEPEDADVVTMHRVVCCYPVYEPLLRKAVQRCGATFALSFPRNRWFIRWWLGAQNLLRRLMGKSFATFVHDPDSMRAIVREAGFERRDDAQTMVWTIEVYSRIRRPAGGSSAHALEANV